MLRIFRNPVPYGAPPKRHVNAAFLRGTLENAFAFSLPLRYTQGRPNGI